MSITLKTQSVFLSTPRQAILVTALCGLGLAACQTTPYTPPMVQTPPPVLTPQPAPASQPPSGVHALPELAEEPLRRQPLPSTGTSSAGTRPPAIIPIPAQPPRRGGVRRDGHNIPAFNGLLTLSRQQISQKKWADAEQTLTRAQRMAPDSPTVYAYFAEIAIQRQQWNRAESMARRGLLLTQQSNQQRTFWQIIATAAQQQGNARAVQEAQQQLASLR
ncbi:MAG: tetratricopeptide repeat protein [Pseudomonadota bacterium]|nr:tetratricopeptide repeat protein [Pseudomonadota bacterium]